MRSPDFLRRLVGWNRLDEAGLAAWDFLPGMRFGDRAAWWRDGADRGAPHEGLDLCFYRTRDGRRLALGSGARVPVIFPGRIVSIVGDFLGTSVFVAHDRLDAAGRRLHTVYGHLEPRPGLAAGSRLRAVDEIGTVAAPPRAGARVPPHLHLTIALIAGAADSARLDWGALHEPARAVLLDPEPILFVP